MSVASINETRPSSAVRENYKYTSLERLLPSAFPYRVTEASPSPPVYEALPAYLAEAVVLFQDPLLEGAVSKLSEDAPRLLRALPAFSNQPEVHRCHQSVESYLLEFSSAASFKHVNIHNHESEEPALQVFYSEVKSGTRARLVLDVNSLPGKTLSLVLLLRLEESAEAEVYLLVSGEGLVRANAYGLLDGMHARLELRGAVLSGSGAHHDVHAVIRHRAPLTTSHQKIRMLGAGQSVTVFSGKIQVEPQASGTEAYQSARGLPLAEDAALYARPFLEIHTDEVRCSHGCTTGHLNEEQVYYLRSRGLPEPLARRLLAEAFVVEAFQDASPAALRDFLTSALQNRLHTCIS